jgi:lycopene cyclase domain-containing protein
VPEYTVAAVASVVVVVALELAWLRTGLFRTLRYWLSMAIVMGFQVPVDGWLTKLSDPIVLYRESETTGWRVPWDIPVEDFFFGFGMVTLTLMIWVRLTGDARTDAPQEARST